MPSGPVRLATAAMALATASSAGAAATASWFDSPRQISPSREIASFVRSIWSASCSETDDPEGEDVLGRLAQRRGVDPRHGDGAFLAEELARDGRAFGGGHEALDGGVDRADALVQRQGDQLVGREPQPVQRVGGGAGPGGRLAETARQILGRLLDAGHRHARQFARALQRLDRGDGGAERLRELGLRIDRLQAGADHRHASGGSGGHGGSGRHPHPAREGREPGVRRFHLAAQPSEAARPGFADAFQLGAHLPSAHGREADADPSFQPWE